MDRLAGATVKGNTETIISFLTDTVGHITGPCKAPIGNISWLRYSLQESNTGHFKIGKSSWILDGSKITDHIHKVSYNYTNSSGINKQQDCVRRF